MVGGTEGQVPCPRKSEKNRQGNFSTSLPVFCIFSVYACNIPIAKIRLPTNNSNPD
jgi:hypothetical protein